MITAALLLVCVLLAGAASAFLVALRRVEARLAVLESHGLATGASAPSSTSAEQRELVSDPQVEEVAQRPSRDPATEEYVITQLGLETDEPAPTLEAKLFADVVLRETVVKAASWAHGIRHGLSPASRNRIWFEMRREVKRARKERKAEEREAVREWRARRRAAVRMQAQEESAA
jgi:hypothetical protein